MKKNRSAYLTGFENATGHRLDVENYVGVEPALQPSAQKRGGDMQGRSRKIESQSFVASQWRPDALVYEGVPKANAVEYMDQPSHGATLHGQVVALPAGTRARQLDSTLPCTCYLHAHPRSLSAPCVRTRTY